MTGFLTVSTGVGAEVTIPAVVPNSLASTLLDGALVVGAPGTTTGPRNTDPAARPVSPAAGHRRQPRREPGRPADSPRCLLARHGITFQRTKTWKESTDPERDTKLDRIEYVLEHLPDRVFAFAEFGPLGIRPTAGSCWAQQSRPDRIPATYHRTHGVTYFHGCYSVGDDTL